VVRVEASGVCRSDWHFWNQDLGWLGFNLTLPVDLLTLLELEVVGSLGNPHPRYEELLALVPQQKLAPARLVTRDRASRRQ